MRSEPTRSSAISQSEVAWVNCMAGSTPNSMARSMSSGVTIWKCSMRIRGSSRGFSCIRRSYTSRTWWLVPSPMAWTPV